MYNVLKIGGSSMPEYRNHEILDSQENIINKFLSQNKSNRYRDNFFPFVINQFGYELGAEIGVDKGEFSFHLLSKTKMRKLFCIDSWVDEFGSNYHKVDYNTSGNVRMEEANTRLQEFIAVDRAELIKATGLEASKEIPNDYLDFVYIDGDHSLEGIFNDIYAWTPKVRVGGIVSGHDYKDDGDSGIKDYWGQQLPYRIKTVVDYYGLRYGYHVNAVGGVIKSFWFVKI